MVRLSPCRSPAPDEFFLRGLEFGKALLKINKGCKKWSSYVKPDYKNALLHKINFDYLFGQTCHALRAHPNNDGGLLIFFSSHHCCNKLARTIQLLSSWQEYHQAR